VKLRVIFFFVPSAILIGFGLWTIGNNITNYFQDIDELNKSKRICNGVPCVCNEPGCFTKADLTIPYASYFSWGIGFISLAVIILVFTKRWWK